MIRRAEPTPASWPVTRTPLGRAYLHIWRTGRSYARQKESLYRREWTNVLFSMQPQPSDVPDIRYHDVRKALPFAEETFDAAYAFHIVEHLTPAEGAALVAELYRVLRPGGIVRISTPDLEDICRSYLRQLDQCRTAPSDLHVTRYRWAVMELLDQLVREEPGGMMTRACARGDFDPAFARERFGDVFDEFSPSGSGRSNPKEPWRERLKRVTLSSLMASVRWRAVAAIDRGHYISVRHLMSGPRQTGELNKWMYDSLSLETLLEAGGFRGHQRQDHRTSMIPDWDRYTFDLSTHGPHAIEPSLYFEARKPS